ncbi:hypothetical protein SE17_04315 [Kouleothrix aurantiaca]|uniref:Uncharacterized protein n=1 Tax=Kouleothrix aurantiaca TaxID=186479 RepID=A0A0P9D5K4_9CHLR|nr:hypothetical protein SE17_04315 [Kouleothrix aurantiaca]
MPVIIDNTPPAGQWYTAIAGIVQTAITVVETLQRAALVYEANEIAALINAATAGHAVEGSTMTKEQAEALNLLITTFGAYLNTPMVEGGLKPINVLYRKWPAPVTD